MNLLFLGYTCFCLGVCLTSNLIFLVIWLFISPLRWLEYRASLKQWQAKPSADKGTDTCTAYCTVPAKCLPQECPVGKWVVSHDDGPDNTGTGFTSQPEVVISILTSEDLEVYYAFVRRAAIRMANEHRFVCITGATGKRAGEINGMYEATTEVALRGDMPVYVKVGKGEVELVYNATNKQWQVRADWFTYLKTHSLAHYPPPPPHTHTHPLSPTHAFLPTHPPPSLYPQVRADSHMVALCLVHAKGAPHECFARQWQV